MLERLFDEVAKRHALRRGPMGPYLDSIATQLLDLGYCRSQARKLVRTASSFGLWFADRGTAPIDAGKAEIKAFIAAQRRMPAGRLPDGAVGCTRLPGLLQANGLLCKEPERFEYPIVRRFKEHLEHARGVQQPTRIEYCRYIHALVAGICTEGEPAWWNMTSEYISDFVLREVPKTRAGRHRVISSVRTFLRFMVCEGLVPVELINAIPRVQRWRYAELPKHLSADELEAVLKACQSNEHASLRDRAFITLLARLGVRAGELRSLALEDIEWTEGLIHIRTSKTGRGRTLPLPRDAGRTSRPIYSDREIDFHSVQGSLSDFNDTPSPHRRLHSLEFRQGVLRKTGLGWTGPRPSQLSPYGCNANGPERGVAETGRRCFRAPIARHDRHLHQAGPAVTARCSHAVDGRKRMKAQELAQRLMTYLHLRAALGSAVGSESKVLESVVAFAERQGDGGSVTSRLVFDWLETMRAQQSAGMSARRLVLVRQFLLHLSAAVPETQVPHIGLLTGYKRHTPFLLTSQELELLLKAAADFRPGKFCSVVLHTILGLIAATGLRASEALGLDRSDVMPRSSPNTILIREAKFGKTRLVPIHDSTAAQLRVYAGHRELLGFSLHTPAFFVSRHRRRLSMAPC